MIHVANPMPRLARMLIALLMALLMVALVIGLPIAPASAGGGFAVGDSVMLGAKSNLQSVGYEVDAAESRSFAAGLAILQQRGAGLPGNVLVHLGTNSEISQGQCEQLVATVGPGRQLTLVNVVIPSYPRVAAANNAVLAACAGAHSNVRLVDWAAFTAANPGVLCGDGIHISCGGSGAYTALVTAGAAATAQSVPAPAPAPAPAPESDPAPASAAVPAPQSAAPASAKAAQPAADNDMPPPSDSAVQDDESAAAAAAAAAAAQRAARLEQFRPGLAEARRVEALIAPRLGAATAAGLLAAR